MERHLVGAAMSPTPSREAALLRLCRDPENVLRKLVDSTMSFAHTYQRLERATGSVQERERESRWYVPSTEPLALFCCLFLVTYAPP